MQNSKPYDKLQTIKTVNGYNIKKLILGKGSSAVTYLCLKKDQVLACKMIVKSDLDKKIVQSSSTEAQQIKTRDYLLNSLRKQISNWKELNHENIVKFLDIAETSNNLYFFLEYCDSKDLATVIAKGKLSYEEGLRYLFDITKGILYLYNRGVFHRDLKPENILIHEGRAKIADFGFSKIMQQAETKDKPETQTTVGTPNYMAIQVLQGEKYSIKCDIWSFGVMIYKMFYGTLPWQEPKTIEHLKKKVKQEIKFPQIKDYPPELEDLIRRMIVIDEEKRLGAAEVYKIVLKMYEKVYGKVMEEEY